MATNSKYGDFELLSRIAEGDEIAMKSLFERYFSRLYYYAFKIVDEESEAEDIAQESLLLFWEKKDQFKNKSVKDAEAFMFTVARNTCLNYIRDRRRHSEKLAYIGSTRDISDHSFELNFIREDIFNRIYEEILLLSPLQVQLMKLIFLENLDTAEIAERLQITPNNVRNLKARALDKLKTSILRKGLLIHILLFFY